MAAPVQLYLFADLAPPQADVWLRRIDPAKNMSRFYAVSVDRDLFGNLLLVRRWGRIGRAGQSKSVVAGSIAAAAEEIARIADAKVRRGYAPS